MPRAAPSPRLDQRRAVVLVAALAALLHLLMAGSLPLLITPDGGEYIRGALALRTPGASWIELNRTPGYHWILSMTFALFGVGAGGVLIVQNLLATATCALVAWAACGIAGPRIGLAVGLLLAIEPWSLGLANYALTETATVFFVVLAASLALGLRRATFVAAITIGGALAAACMMRPAVQALVPFFALAWVAGVPAVRRRRVQLGATVAAAFLVCCVPWLAYNAARGVRGFAGMAGTSLWYGVAMAGLLDATHPVDPATRDAVDRFLAPGVSDAAVHQVIFATDGYRSPAQDRRLGEWARHSVAARPLAYLGAAGDALLWQLDAGIAGRPPMYDELPFFLERLTGDTPQPPRGASPNFQNPGPLPSPWAFTVGWHGGVMQAYLRWASAGWLRGIPQLPLFVCALLACVLAPARRAWPLALVLAGSLAFVFAHAALLLPVARHAAPAWTLWYLGLAFVLRIVTTRGAHQLPASAASDA